MGTNGLSSSKWATITDPGDWNCHTCGFSNFKWRRECFRCAKGATASRVKPVEPLYHPLEEKTNTSQHTIIDQPGTGLMTSRWAPRNQRKVTPVAEVWTRTVPKSSIPSTPDLGLPYEVQHFILAMIQRILEEACYDFASRWIPSALRGRGWNCPEAVELSSWRTFLPDSLPPNSVQSHYPLERALADAVRIRNAAVHRHLCDNNEIRKMTRQAQELMAMFSDMTRQHKFHRLLIELDHWDLQEDSQVGRKKLQKALYEISERPMDDMDWTPNAVSLQEIVEAQATEVYGEYTQEDAMELD